jgi:uncharacterized protein
MSLPPSDHRPWPLPRGAWVMAQRWHDLLFAHWPVPVAALRPLVPPSLEVETFDGSAWLGVVPFWMSRVRARFLPPVPGLSRFPELNVRTYVRAEGKSGVWFFSLDATNPVAVAAGCRMFHLPYFRAHIRVRGTNAVQYESRRTHRGAPPAELRARYRPIGEPFRAAPGTLVQLLTERYCLYAVDARARLFRCEIHHAPWPLQPADAEIDGRSMAAAAGIRLPDTRPLVHFARRQDVVVWRPRLVAEGGDRASG